MKYRLTSILTEGPEMMYKENFWKLFPEVKNMDPFFGLYATDTNKKKTKSSNIMWAFVLVIHPESMFYNLPDKYIEVARIFLDDEKFNWDDYDKHISKLKELFLTQSERSLIVWEETMRMRDKSVKSLYEEVLNKKDVALIEKMDKILANNSKFFIEYDKIKEMLSKEDTTKKTKEQSLSDSDEI